MPQFQYKESSLKYCSWDCLILFLMLSHALRGKLKEVNTQQKVWAIPENTKTKYLQSQCTPCQNSNTCQLTSTLAFWSVQWIASCSPFADASHLFWTKSSARLWKTSWYIFVRWLTMWAFTHLLSVRANHHNHPYRKDYCPGHAGVGGNEQADRLAKATDITTGLQFSRAKMLKSLRNFLNTDTPQYHSTNHLKKE